MPTFTPPRPDEIEESGFVPPGPDEIEKTPTAVVAPPSTKGGFGLGKFASGLDEGLNRVSAGVGVGLGLAEESRSRQQFEAETKDQRQQLTEQLESARSAIADDNFRIRRNRPRVLDDTARAEMDRIFKDSTRRLSVLDQAEGVMASKNAEPFHMAGANSAEEAQSFARLKASQPGPESMGTAGTFVGQAAGLIAPSAIPGAGPAISAAVAGLSSAGDTYEQAREAYTLAGLAPDEAEDRAQEVAANTGLVNGAIFLVPVGKLASLPATRLARLLTASGLGGTQMGLGTLQSELQARATYNPNLTLGQIAKDSGQSFVGGALLSGLMHSPDWVKVAVTKTETLGRYTPEQVRDIYNRAKTGDPDATTPQEMEVLHQIVREARKEGIAGQGAELGPVELQQTHSRFESPAVNAFLEKHLGITPENRVVPSQKGKSSAGGTSFLPPRPTDIEPSASRPVESRPQLPESSKRAADEGTPTAAASKPSPTEEHGLQRTIDELTAPKPELTEASPERVLADIADVHRAAGIPRAPREEKQPSKPLASVADVLGAKMDVLNQLQAKLEAEEADKPEGGGQMAEVSQAEQPTGNEPETKLDERAVLSGVPREVAETTVSWRGAEKRLRRALRQEPGDVDEARDGVMESEIEFRRAAEKHAISQDRFDSLSAYAKETDTENYPDFEKLSTGTPANVDTPNVGTAKPAELIPALKTSEGKVIEGTRGKTHQDIYDAQPGTEGLMLKVDQPEHGFVRGGQFLSREQAAAALGEKEPLQSERLRELQDKPKEEAIASGKEEVVVDDLMPGDVLDIEGERVEVIDRNEHTGAITVKDGRTFGEQVLESGRKIYVENIEGAEGSEPTQFAAGKTGKKSRKDILQDYYADLAKEEFPAIPDADARRLAEHLSSSHGVMQSEELSPNDAMRRAVRAYIRHHKTNYESNFNEGIERGDNRDFVRKQIDAVYDRWREGYKYPDLPDPEPHQKMVWGISYIRPSTGRRYFWWNYTKTNVESSFSRASSQHPEHKFSEEYFEIEEALAEELADKAKTQGWVSDEDIETARKSSRFSAPSRELTPTAAQQTIRKAIHEKHEQQRRADAAGADGGDNLLRVTRGAERFARVRRVDQGAGQAGAWRGTQHDTDFYTTPAGQRIAGAALKAGFTPVFFTGDKTTPRGAFNAGAVLLRSDLPEAEMAGILEHELAHGAEHDGDQRIHELAGLVDLNSPTATRFRARYNSWLTSKGIEPLSDAWVRSELAADFVAGIDAYNGVVTAEAFTDLQRATQMAYEYHGIPSQFAGGEFSFDAPESVTDQKARQTAEKRKAESGKAKTGMLERADARLTGEDIDTTSEMFGADVKVDKAGQGSLFTPGGVDAQKQAVAAAEQELRDAIRDHMNARDLHLSKSAATKAKDAAHRKFQQLERQLLLFPDYVRDLINTATTAAQADDTRTMERVLAELDRVAAERLAGLGTVDIERRLKLTRLDQSWRAAIAEAQKTGDWQKVMAINDAITAALSAPASGNRVNVDVRRSPEETRDLISSTVDALNMALDEQSRLNARSAAIPGELNKLVSDLKTRLQMLKGWADDATELASAGAPRQSTKPPSPELRQKFMEVEAATDPAGSTPGEWFDKLKTALRYLASPVPEIPLYGEISERAATFLRGFRLFNTETNRVRKEAAERVNRVLEPLAPLRTRAQNAALKEYYKLGTRLNRLRGAGKEADAAKVAARMTEIERESLDQDPFNLFRKMVVYRDLFWRAVTLKTPDGKPITLPNNLTVQEVQAELARLTKTIDAHPNQAQIIEALQRHYKLVDDLQKSIIDHGEIIPEAMRNPLYFPHHMIDNWTGTMDAVRPSTEADFRRYLIDPKGSGKLIQSDYLKAMYIHTADVMAHNARVDLVQKYWQPYDISPRLKQEHGEAWDKPWNIPGGYRIFAPYNKIPLRMDYIIDRETLAEKLGVLFNDGDLRERVKGSGAVLNIKPEDLRMAMVAGEKLKWVLPVEIADALDGITRREAAARNPGLGHALGLPFRKLVNFWKKLKLFAPWNYIRYEYGNTLTDVVDKYLVADPRAAAKLGQAANEIMAAGTAGAETSEAFKAAAREGVFDTITAAEAGELQRLPSFNEFLTQGEATRVAIRKWAESTVRVSRFRESVFRYAKFLADVERMQAGKPPVYAGAGNRDIEALGKVQDGQPRVLEGDELIYAKAAEISLKTFGDYNSLGVGGQWLRTNLIPFWSWTDVNFRYHANQMRNIADGIRYGKGTDHQTALRYAAVRVLVTLFAIGLAKELWNQFGGVMAGLWDDDDDLEKNLSEADRRRPHLILGKDKDGKTMVVYTPSAFGDVAEWVGGTNLKRLTAEYLRGQITFSQMVRDFAKQLPTDFVNKLAQGSGPHFKGVYETVSGKAVFPDVTDQRSIPKSDRWWRLAGTLTDDRVVNFARSYLDADYMAQPAGEQLQQIILQVRRRDPEQWAYYEAREDVADWKERKTGKRFQAGDYTAPEAQALRNFKRSIYRGDVDNAEKFYTALMRYGYTSKRLDASIRNAHPLADLSQWEMPEYLAQMTPRQKQEMELAIRYYNRMGLLDGAEKQLFPEQPMPNAIPNTNGLRQMMEAQRRQRETVAAP